MDISKKIIALSITTILPSFVLAEDRFEFDFDDISFRPVVAIHGGEAIGMGIGSSQNYDVDFTDYDYDANKETQIRGVFGGLIGVELKSEDYEDWSLQTGISYYQTTPFSPEGTLVQRTEVEKQNINTYNFDITTHQILWETKLLRDWDRYHPYVSVGLGLSINRADEFNTNVPPFRTFTPMYEDNTQTSFSYSFGLGLDYDLTDHFRLGLGYRFTDLGEASLGDAKLDTETISHSLEQDNLYAQEIILQLSYLL